MRILRENSEDEMIVYFLRGELTSRRFGPGPRAALSAAGLSERLLTDADLSDEDENRARRDLLGTTRGYGQNRDVFDEGLPRPGQRALNPSPAGVVGDDHTRARGDAAGQLELG
jgi:hypothetical protein